MKTLAHVPLAVTDLDLAKPLGRHSLSRRSAFTLLFLFTQLRGRLDPGRHEDTELLDAITCFEAQVDLACRPMLRNT